MNESCLDKSILKLSTLLIKQRYKVAVAESCTGGWVAKAATDLPGSSSWFDRGLVTYSNESKQELLEVHTETLLQYGAVSKQVAVEMVAGLLRFNNVSIGVAITGIAGPKGGSAEKPVGTVWVAWQEADKSAVTHCFTFSGNREQVRLKASIEAVNGLVRLLSVDQ